MQAQFFDFYRSGIKTAAEFARTSLENTVRMQQKQLELVRNILEEGERSSERLGEAKSIQELVGQQTQLAGKQIQRVAEFWTSAWQLAADNQKAVMEQWQQQVGDAARSSEEMARAATAQISRAAGSLRENTPANNERGHRKSA